jgi:hypothetical protein
MTDVIADVIADVMADALADTLADVITYTIADAMGANAMAAEFSLSTCSITPLETVRR